MVPVVFVEMNIACFACRELASTLVASDRRVTMVYRNMIGYRIVSAINLVANCASKSIQYTFNIFFISTPSCKYFSK